MLLRASDPAILAGTRLAEARVRSLRRDHDDSPDAPTHVATDTEMHATAIANATGAPDTSAKVDTDAPLSSTNALALSKSSSIGSAA